MKKYWLLIIALLLGALLRLYQLGSLPGALTWDEASLGYNAFSILKTGRDEYGKLLPIIFKSFGDYKPGLYVYLAIPSIAILGLTEFAVRFPSAIFGLLSILGVYLLTKELFAIEKKKDLIASLAAFSLAIMPLHIHFSRGAWETNVYVTLLLYSIYFLIRFTKEGKFFNLSLILGLLTFFTYQAAKLFTPLSLIFTIIIFRQGIIAKVKLHLKNPFNLAVLIFSIVVVLYLFLGSVTGDSGNRLKRLSVFGYRPGVSSQTKSTDSQNPLTISLFHNQAQLTTRLVASRYLKHLSPKLLFYEGYAPVERGHLPGMGILSTFDFIWVVLGLVFLTKSFPSKITLFIIGLLLLSPLPGSLTLSEFSTVRSLFLVIPLAIICGAGAFFAFEKIKSLFVIATIFTAIGFFYQIDQLFVHANFVYTKEFQYGYKEAMQFIKAYPDSKVVMTDVWGQPYIFYLFYSRFDPATYQKLNAFTSGGFDVGMVSHIGNKIEFHQFGKNEIENQSNTIFVGTIGNIDNHFDFSLPTIERHEDVYYPDGKIMLRIIKTKTW
jgi:4-amino-4-deoxy-L-arabinose transferase-like glycosyltransferase